MTTIDAVTVHEAADSSLAGSVGTPAPADSLSLSRLGAYETGSGAGSAEVFAYDKLTQNLFVMNNVTGAVEIVAVSGTGAMTKIGAVQVSGIPGYGGMNSIAIAGGILAVAVENPVKSEPGTVALFSTSSGALLKTVTVGSLPDMLTFTPDGTRILVANEGENPPIGGVDARGSVSVIDVSAGAANATVQAVGFEMLDGHEGALRAAGVRIFPGTSASFALEPEYITITSDGRTAYVTLQENNAVAVIDLSGTTPTLKSIVPLGYVDHSLPGNGADFSDRDGPGSGSSSLGAISINTAPIRGLLMPDAIASWTKDGITYFVTANEGDTRVDGSDEARLSSRDLNDAVFGAAEAVLRGEDEAGRLTISATDGNTDPAAPGLEAVYAFGGRGFSVFRVEADGSVTKVDESGGEFEAILAELPNAGTVFNGENGGAFDTRSDNKGPEPEGIDVATIDGRTYSFVGLERIGGVMVYDVTRPSAIAFDSYVPATAKDYAPEIVKYVAAGESPTGTGLLFTANEVSGSVTAYQVKPTTFKLQLLHFADGEAGLLAPKTAPNLAALVDAFDGQYNNTLILAERQLASGAVSGRRTDPTVIATLNRVSGSTLAAGRPSQSAPWTSRSIVP
jgi:DNA-binding beta-propeller fold protein YncE